MKYSQRTLDLHHTEVAIRDLIIKIQETQKLLNKLLQDLDVLVVDFTNETAANDG